MSRFDTSFSASGHPQRFDEFGQSITYAGDPNIDDVALTAIVTQVNASADETDGDRVRDQQRTVTIMRDPASSYGGVAAVSDDAHFLIDGEQWVISAKVGHDPMVWELDCVFGQVLEIGVEGYRKAR